MSLTLVDDYNQAGLNTTYYIPVFRNGFNEPNFQVTKDTISKALRDAEIDHYKCVEDNAGFTLYTEGPNTLALFCYFFEGDRAEELHFTITPEDPEELTHVGECASEFVSQLDLRNPSHVQATPTSIIMTFYTRGDYYTAIRTMERAVQEETEALAQLNNTPSPI